MAIRSIIVNIDIDNFSPPLIASAVALAQRHDAKLIAVAAAGAPVAMAGIDGQAAASIYTIELTDVEERLRELEGKYRSLIPAGMAVDWRAWVETPARCLATMASAADLILVAAAAKRPSSFLRSVDIGELVLSSGRPVLIVKPDTGPITADRIIVGWKNTREARRAIADALPFLTTASAVQVASISEGEPDVEQTSLDDALAWLAAYGVKAEGKLHPSSHSPAETILSLAQTFGADLIVTGAYGHSRVREWLLGGMTHDLIGESTINRLISN